MTIKLLLVDDHEIVRLGLHTVLDELEDMEVVAEAGDGATAISESLKHSPDVVLMDIRMPKMDGIEATREIKDKLPGTHVLILTSNDNQEAMFASLAAGADGYCLKDTPGDQLVTAIQSVHSGAAWLDPMVARFVIRAATVQSSRDPFQALIQSPPIDLTDREIEDLHLLVEGCTNSEISTRLFSLALSA
jgi:DNA-binding NarL/FixJ family response regulator